MFVQVSGGLADCELLEKQVRRGPLKRKLDSTTTPTSRWRTTSAEEDLDRAFYELADFECTFDVTEFHLYEHGPDGVWRPVRTFALGGAAD